MIVAGQTEVHALCEQTVSFGGIENLNLNDIPAEGSEITYACDRTERTCAC